MTIVPDEDGHVRTALGLYFLGGLDREQQAAVERHLAHCGQCLAEYTETGEVTSYLDVLDEDDADELSEPSEGAVRSPVQVPPVEVPPTVPPA